jgi:hypothetical protein
MNTKAITRNLLMAGAVPLLLASSAFAQYGTYNQRQDQQIANRGWANRVVEGTIASASLDRRGNERIRLTNGMDLVVPNSIVPMNGGRSYQWSLLQPGDTVRMNVYSREGDGRDAQVKSFEILQIHGRGVIGNDRQINGTVVSFDRRNNIMVVQADSGRAVNIDLGTYSVNNRNARFRRGDRVTIDGRMDRGTGRFFADGVRTY